MMPRAELKIVEKSDNPRGPWVKLQILSKSLPAFLKIGGENLANNFDIVHSKINPMATANIKTDVTQPTAALLDGYLGKNITEICSCEYKSDNDNHCAHFVSHVMGYRFGLTCHAMTGQGHDGVTIRVHELFPQCPMVGEWKHGIIPNPAGLAFVVFAAHVNLAEKRMTNVPKKHVGIFIGNGVWHYSNKRDHVIKQPVDDFRDHYTGDNITVYWGKFPTRTK